MNAYEAILEALIARGRTGEGAEISVSMFDAMAEWMTVPLLHGEGGVPFKRIGLAHAAIAPYGVFKTQDGADILISIQNDREWRVLAEKVLGDEALAADPSFATNIEARRKPGGDRRQGRGRVSRARRRRADEEAGSRRHRLRARQRLGAAVEASASAPDHGRLAERAGDACRRRRRCAPARSAPMARSRRSASTRQWCGGSFPE